MMSAGTLVLIVLGLCLFETVSSLDNAVGAFTSAFSSSPSVGGALTMSEAFGAHLPQRVSPAATFVIIGGAPARSLGDNHRGPRSAGGS